MRQSTPTTTGFNAAMQLFPQEQQRFAPVQKEKERSGIMAIRPTIPAPNFRQNMDNYRLFISRYNTALAKENAEIDNHNQEVKIFLATASDVHRAYDANFRKLRKNEEKKNGRKYNVREYNALADDPNAKYGPIVYKKRLQKVKFNTELVFANLLHLYNLQLTKENNYRNNARNFRRMALPAFRVNAYLATEMERPDGFKSIEVCRKTIRNHRARLEEAGVFINAMFRGRKAAYEIDFNPEILVVFDSKTHKNLYAGTQPLKLEERKNLPFSSSNTGTGIKGQVQERGNASQLPDKESALRTPLPSQEPIDGNTTLCSYEDSPGGAAAEVLKIPQKSPSEQLEALILPVNTLDARLRTGCYDYYKPIPIRDLFAEATGGSMTNEEYRELVLQDFLKFSARLYKGMAISPGCWANTYKMLMDEMFITFRKVVIDKYSIASKVQELRYRILYAARWFTKHKMTPLYPSRYFDPSRKKKEEMGFGYTIQAWKSHLTEPAKQKRRVAKREAEAEGRIVQINHAKKYKRKVEDYLKGKCNVYQLSEYVLNNLPKNYYARLGHTLDLKQAEENLKYMN